MLRCARPVHKSREWCSTSLDLKSYRVDTDERQAGRIRVIVGSESAIDPKPATRAPVLAPAAPVPANSSSPPVAPTRIAVTTAPPVPAANSTPAKVEALAPPRRLRRQRSPGLHQLEVPCCLLRSRDRRSRCRRSRSIANRYLASLHGWWHCERSSPESMRARTSVPTL